VNQQSLSLRNWKDAKKRWSRTQGYSSSLEQSHAAEAWGAGKININEVQSPSPPMRDSAKLKKMAGMILGLGIAGAIALAFLIEWFLDPSIKRTGDVETKLQMPVFLSIRDMNWKDPSGCLARMAMGSIGAVCD